MPAPAQVGRAQQDPAAQNLHTTILAAPTAGAMTVQTEVSLAQLSAHSRDPKRVRVAAERHVGQVVAPERAGSLDRMQNSLPSGSASVIQPLPSGRRWSASCDAPSARIRSVS